MHIELDSTDKGIINILQQDAKIPYADIGKQLYVSAGTVHARIKKLERLGIIKKPLRKLIMLKLALILLAF